MTLVFNAIDELRVLKHPCNKTVIKVEDDCYCDQGYVKPQHGFFLHPTIWEPTTELVPIFSPGTLSACFRDILIPSKQHFHQEMIFPPNI